MDLFSAEAGLQPIPIEDGELAMLAQLPLPIPNADVLRRLVDETPWRAETIVVYGQRHLQPRLTAWYGDAGYTYSGLTLDPLPMTPLLRQLHAAGLGGLAIVFLNYLDEMPYFNAEVLPRLVRAGLREAHGARGD